MLFDPKKCDFVINGVAYPADEEKFYIYPYGEIEERLTLNMEKNIYPKFQFKIHGLSVLENKSPAQVKNFALSGGSESFKIGAYSCKLLSEDVSGGDILKVKFSCIYTGDNIAIVQPQKPTVLFSTGRELDVQQNQKLRSVTKNEEFEIKLVCEDFTRRVDIPSSNSQIIWNGTFLEFSENLLPEIKVNFLLNPKITNPKYLEQ